MDNDAKLRPLYLAKILYEQTDEEHFLTTAQLIQILEERYGINAHRQTIKAEIELLKQFGLEIEEAGTPDYFVDVPLWKSVRGSSGMVQEVGTGI